MAQQINAQPHNDDVAVVVRQKEWSLTTPIDIAKENNRTMEWPHCDEQK